MTAMMTAMEVIMEADSDEKNFHSPMKEKWLEMVGNGWKWLEMVGK